MKMWLLSIICIVFSAVYAREINKIVSTPTPNSIDEVLIVGGHDIDIKEAPFQVSLAHIHNGEFFCGGSIIAKDIILTAAHCLEGESTSDLQIRAGSSSYKSGGLLVPVSDLVYHRHFSIKTLDYDIGLLKLSTPLEFSDTVKPIDMMKDKEELDDGAITNVTGWGFTSEMGELPQTLQQVSVQKVNDEVCRSEYSQLIKITERMLCAGVPNGGKDSCEGDSGGPLVHNGRLAGVVSFGNGCALADFPGVYSKVSALRTWIDEHIKFLRSKKIL